MEEINDETKIVNSLCEEWGVEKSKILQTANRFFTDYKKFGSRIKKLDQNLLEYQLKLLLSSDIVVAYHFTDHENPSVYCSFMNNYIEDLSRHKKGIIFFNEDFIYGMMGNQNLLPETEFKKLLDSLKKENVEMKYKSQSSISLEKKKKVDNIYQFMIIHKFNPNALVDIFNSYKFTKI